MLSEWFADSPERVDLKAQIPVTARVPVSRNATLRRIFLASSLISKSISIKNGKKIGPLESITNPSNEIHWNVNSYLSFK